MTSFVASPGHQHPQCCNNVIHSVYNHKKRSEGLAIESPTSTRLCLMVLFRFCSYLWCLSIGDLYDFRLCFDQNNIAPRGATLRDYICLLVQITNRWYVRNHFISNVLKKRSYSVSTQAQWPCSSPSVTSFPAGRGNRSYLLPREKFKLPYLPNQAN